MTLRTALARVITQMEADGKSPLTIAVYRAELERFVAWTRPRTDVRRMRPPDQGEHSFRSNVNTRFGQGER